MSKIKGKSSSSTSALQVVGVVYNHNKDDRSLRLIDFLQAGRNFADHVSAKAEEEEVERLKAENDQRVEELLAKAKEIKQRSTSESENQKDTASAHQSEIGNLEQKSKPKIEENGNVVNKTEKPHSKADALERLRRMEWKRSQEDHKDISRSNNGRQEFPPLTKNKDDEYFSGTRVKKSREKKKNREEVVVSLEKLDKCQSTVLISEKNSKIAHTILPPSNSCWQNRGGAALFEDAKIRAEKDAEDVELNWALSESLREQKEQQKRFMEILTGSCMKTNRIPPGIMSIPPPEPDKEENWDGDESDYTDAEESLEDSKREDQAKVKGKQVNKGNDWKENVVSKTYTAATTTTTTNDKSLSLYHNGNQRNVNGAGHFSSAQQRINKLATNQSDKLKHTETECSDTNRSYTPSYQLKREQTHLVEHTSNIKFEGDSRLLQRFSDSLANKSNTVHRQEHVIKSVKHTTLHKSLDHGNRSHVYRNVHDFPSASNKTRKDGDLNPKILPLESSPEQKHISQSDVKNDISQSFSALHIETGRMRNCEEGKLKHQNSAVANKVPYGSHESSPSSMSSDKVSHFQAKTQEFDTANMQHLAQEREQQIQQLSTAAVPHSICMPFSAQGISASAEQYQQEKQPPPSQSVHDQSVSSDTYASLMEELQRIRMYQNLLMQMSAQESLQMAVQQQLQSMNTLRTSNSTLTQEQLQMMFLMQHQQTLMPNVKTLLQLQTQNTPPYSAGGRMWQSQYPGTALSNPKDTSEHPQTPAVSPGSPDNVTIVQKHFQDILQQQHLNALLHTGFPYAGVTGKEQTQQQQWDGVAQPGTQTSAAVHLSLQTSYPNAPQSGFVGPTQFPQPMPLQQQSASNMHVVKPPSPQSLIRAPSHMNSTATNATVSTVETIQCPESMFLQQQYVPNILTSSQAAQSLTRASSNVNPTATNVPMSALEATQYNMRAQLMTGLFNQQPTEHSVAGLVPLVPQEKPKSKGRGRLLQ